MRDDSSFDVTKFVFQPTVAGHYLVNGVEYYFVEMSKWKELERQLSAARAEIEAEREAIAEEARENDLFLFAQWVLSDVSTGWRGHYPRPLSLGEDQMKEVIDLFNKWFGQAVTPATSLESLGLDSLDTAEICINLEDELEIELPLEESAKWVTVGDIIAAVQKELDK